MKIWRFWEQSETNRVLNIDIEIFSIAENIGSKREVRMKNYNDKIDWIKN